jgi:O-antigen ligase
MGFITLVLCTYGLLIHFKIYLVHDWRYINFAQGGSLSANFANHNHLAGWLEMMIFLWTGLLFARKRSLIKTVVIVFILLVMIASIIFSLSRGGWIATLTGAGFILLATRFHNTFLVPKKILSITIVLFFCLVLGILGSGSVVKRGMTVVEQQSDVIPARTIAWTGAVEMIKTYPLTGVGIGNFPIIFTQFQPPGLNFRFYELHNDYLQFTAEMGLFFIPLLLWLIFNLFKTGFKKLDHPSRQTRWITLGAMGGVVAILVHSVSDFNLQFPSNALLFTLLAAQVAAPAPALKRR